MKLRPPGPAEAGFLLVDGLMGLKNIGLALPSISLETAPRPPKQADRFYHSPEWRSLIARLVAQRGRRCEDPLCKQPGRVTRIFGDHIVELQDGGAPLDPSNVMLRCGSCHTRKTGEARVARAAPLPHRGPRGGLES